MQTPALIRTIVPSLVGALLSFLATYGISVDGTVKEALVVGLSGVLAAVYYALVSMIETRWPLAGLLLGSTERPSYQGKHRKDADSSSATATLSSPADRE